MTMAPEGQPKPYAYDNNDPPPSEVLQLWTEVGNGIDKNQTGAFCGSGHFVEAGLSKTLVYSVAESTAKFGHSWCVKSRGAAALTLSRDLLL